MFWTQTKLQWGGKEAWPKCWNAVQSAVSPCTTPPHHTVFVHLTWEVRLRTIKRDKLWLQFSPVEPLFCFFWERQHRQGGETDREKPHHITTLQALMRGSETGAHPVSGCHGNLSTWRAEWTQTSLPRFERSRIDMSARPKGKAEREETFPVCIFFFVKLNTLLLFQKNLFPHKEKKKSRGEILKRHGLSWYCW